MIVFIIQRLLLLSVTVNIIVPCCIFLGFLDVDNQFHISLRTLVLACGANASSRCRLFGWKSWRLSFPGQHGIYGESL